MVVLTALFSLALPLETASPAGAQPLPMELSMVPGQGLLTLRDAEEPTSLPDPLTVDGSVETDTGVVSGGSFTATPIEFELPVPEFHTTAFITATFSQLVPESVTGTVNSDGDVTLNVDVKVDLHIEVGDPSFLEADCTASPVALRLSSVEPYDRETEQVTLVDQNVSVPAVPVGGSCIEIIATEVNETLAGSGHSIELGMTGTVPEIPDVGDFATTTGLTVEPETSRPGKTVTLTAQVAPVEGDDPPAVAPTGLVEFRDGGVVIAQQPIDGSGTAALTTSELPVGAHAFSARYLGDAEYARSTSATVDHLVAANPTVTVDMASTVLIGGLPRSATITVSNPAEHGAPIEDNRLDFSIGRVSSPSANLSPTRVIVEWFNEGTWEVVPLTAQGTQTVLGSIAPAGGISLAAGEEEVIRLRITVPIIGTQSDTLCASSQRTCPGPVRLTATLNQLDAEGNVVEAMASAEHPFTLVEVTRRVTNLTFLASPRPHTVRQGYAVEFITRVAPTFGGILPTGTAEIFVDGRPAGVRAINTPFEEGYLEELPVVSSVIQGHFLLAPDFDLGTHNVTIRYNGDAIYAPSEVTSTFTVLESAGFPFVCQSAGVGSTRNEWGANIVFDAEVPALATAGDTVELDVSSAVMLMNRPFSTNPLPSFSNGSTTQVGAETVLKGITFGLGPNGQGAATAMERQGATPMATSPNPAPPEQVDQTITFHGPTASVVVAADARPGDVVPVELDEIVVDFVQAGSIPTPLKATCVPADEPMPLGEVEVAGTTVSVSLERVREGTDEVTIEAETFPADAAGTVTFSSDLDGELGTDVVTDGVSSISTDELSPGTHVISASFAASDPGVPDSVGMASVTVSYSPRSGTEAFVVAARTDFLGSAEPEDVVADAEALDGGLSRVAYLRSLSRSEEYLTRVVNGLYVDTLGRPGDEAGVAFWVDQLRNGWPVARVAASFYGSGEYFAGAGGGTVETWVEDLYLTLLGRASDPGGHAFWVAEVARLGRAGVALRFFQTPESARARVVALYERFLGRVPSRADQDFWATRVVANGDLALAVYLTVSAEYDRGAATRFPLV